MDLITYALSKKGSGGSVSPIIPTIGENGNWYINGTDTGKRAVATDVDVDELKQWTTDAIAAAIADYEARDTSEIEDYQPESN